MSKNNSLVNSDVAINNKFGLFLIFLFLLLSPPFVFELFPSMPGWKIFNLITFPPMLAFAIAKKYKLMGGNIRGLMQFWIICWLIFSIIHQDMIYISRCLITVIALLTVSVINGIGLRQFCKLFIYIMALFSFLGAIFFFIELFLHVSPIFEYENADGKTGYFFGITCTNAFNPLYYTIRYSGFFDEPGAMGLWGGVALLLNKLLFDNKRIELVLIISLLFTFSLGYFASLFLYALFFLLDKKMKIWILPLLLLLSISIVFIIQNEHLYNITFGRMTYDSSTGTIEGNNRHDAQIYAEKCFLESPIVGIGAQKALELDERGMSINDNIYSPLARDGVFGVLIIYLPFVSCLLMSRKNKLALKCMLIFALSFFHRGVSFTTFHLVMYVAFLEVIRQIVIVRGRSKVAI
jgi:hypothetical protein